MTNEIAQRHRWTVETLSVDPADHVLEIGCGYGVAVSLLCEELTTGTVTAIDRSETMIERASKRNTDCVSSGTATFQTAAVETADLGDTTFDTIFAVNVSLFRNQPEKGLPVVKNQLRADGAFYIFHQPPTERTVRETTDTLLEVLPDYGFVVDRVSSADIEPATITCVVCELP